MARAKQAANEVTITVRAGGEVSAKAKRSRRKRSIEITLLLHPEEKAAIERAAAKDYRTQTEFCRAAVLRTAHGILGIDPAGDAGRGR